MHGRIEAGFRARLRAVVSLLPAGHDEGEVDRLVADAKGRAGIDAAALARLLAEAHDRLVLEARAPGRTLAAVPPWARFDVENPPRFLCDPSLGGLARWLRAAGYEADLAPDVPGHRLPDEALRRGRVLLTTEAEVLDRRIVTDGSLVVAWVPSALTMAEQLRMVSRELGLSLREPRCMACGGVLVRVAKEAVRARIPPRTALWKDDYFTCTGCDRLFWQGTHWERIEKALHATVAA